MSTSDSTKLIESWAQAWTSPDGLEKLLSLFIDDCVYEDVGIGMLTHGKVELKNFFEAIRHAIPDFKMELTSHFHAGNWAGAECVWSGTQTGDFPGIPATNKYASIRAATVFELQGDRFKRCSDYWDMATYLRQAGLTPSE